jgi:hypothetical protein
MRGREPKLAEKSPNLSASLNLVGYALNGWQISLTFLVSYFSLTSKMGTKGTNGLSEDVGENFPTRLRMKVNMLKHWFDVDILIVFETELRWFHLVL